ncbi:MAG: hypothetical protein WCG04_03490, partial [Alphaproteobacteria bacterium]
MKNMLKNYIWFFFVCFMQVAYCANAAFDGLGEALGVVNTGIDPINAKPVYLGQLGDHRLSKSDEPSVMGGYLSLLKKTKTGEYKKLTEQPNKAAYVAAFQELNDYSGLFADVSTKKRGNFALNTIDILQKTVGYYDSVPHQQTVEEGLHVSDLTDQVEDASHKILAGAFGLRKKSATPEEAKGIAMRLIDRAERLAQKWTPLQTILKNYDAKKAQGIRAAKHVQACRDIISAAYEYYEGKQEDVTEQDLGSAARIPGVLDAFKERGLIDAPIDDA